MVAGKIGGLLVHHIHTTLQQRVGGVDSDEERHSSQYNEHERAWLGTSTSWLGCRFCRVVNQTRLQIAQKVHILVPGHSSTSCSVVQWTNSIAGRAHYT